MLQNGYSLEVLSDYIEKVATNPNKMLIAEYVW